MRASKLFAPTLREAPAEAEAASHVLLLRAAFIRKVAAGIYTNLPLGVRSMRRIEEIVRGEFVPMYELAERIQREAFCPDGVQVLAEYQRRSAVK